MASYERGQGLNHRNDQVEVDDVLDRWTFFSSCSHGESEARVRVRRFYGIGGYAQRKMAEFKRKDADL